MTERISLLERVAVVVAAAAIIGLSSWTVVTLAAVDTKIEVLDYRVRLLERRIPH